MPVSIYSIIIFTASMDTTDPSGDYYLSFQSDGVMSDSTWASYSVGSHHKHQQVKLTLYSIWFNPVSKQD